MAEDVNALTEFRDFLNSIKSKLRLPTLYWSDGPSKRVGRLAVAGEELWAECSVFAIEVDKPLTSIQPADVERLAWKLSNESRYTKGIPDAEQQLTDATIEQTLDLTQRTVRLLGKDMLTSEQREVLLSGSLLQIAEKRGCARSSASRLRARAMTNLATLVHLDSFLFGDWELWFEQHAADWNAPILRTDIWQYLKPGAGHTGVRDVLKGRQQEMLTRGIQLLADQARAGTRARPGLVAQAYNLCITGTHIDPRKATDAVAELQRSVAGKPLLFMRMGTRCGHLLLKQEELLQYRASLESSILYNRDEAQFDARCYAVYYGSVEQNTERRFVGGDYSLRESEFTRPDMMVKESWENLGEKQYRDSTILDDINFLRCIHTLKALRFLGKLSQTSMRLLRILCQHAKKSNYEFVSNLARDVGGLGV